MSSKNAPTIPVAVFDISSSSVGGAHALVKKGAQTTASAISVLAQSRVESVLQEELNIERFVSETLKGIESVATAIRAQDAHHPEYIQVVLASPWYMSQTRTIVYNKTTTFVCTEKLINSLIDKEIEFIITNEKDRFGALGTEYSIVEKQVSLIKLNGYVTHAPYGKSATSLELYITVTVAPKKVLDQCTDLLRRIYGTRQIAITTSAYTTFIATRELLNAPERCALVDIGEEVTDVAFVKDQLFLYQHSFPVGTYELYRAVAEITKIPFTEVGSMLEAYRLQKLAPHNKSQIEKALTTFNTRWQKGLQTIVDEGHYGFALPSTWYTVVDPRFEKTIETILANDPYLSHRADKNLTAIMITPDTIPLVKSVPDTVLDVPLALALLFIDRLV
ncbi:hypothetical protein K2Q02_01560 [Patescibacteria group bacterium]|nr:hypothetical protein [Patescibacteria group bacterium]